MSNSAIDFPWDWKHVTENVTVCDHPCVLHHIVINHCDDHAISVTAYDGTDNTGDVIAVIDVDLPAEKTYHINPVTLSYDLKCANGIYMEFSDTPSNSDLTVMYK